MRDRLAQVASIIALLVAWALLAIFIGGGILPGPLEVVPALGRLITTGAFAGPLGQSLTRTAVGFLVGFVAGTAIGIASAKLPRFSLTTSPLLNIVLFAPTLVIIFLGITILGTQLFSVAVIVGLAVAPNVAIYMRDVMKDFDPEIVAMADSFHLGTRQRVRDLYLPYLVPPMLAAARIGFSLSWKVIMLSEVFGFPGGLGFQIRINYTVYNLTALLAWLSIFVIALLFIEQLIRRAEHTIVKWQT